MITTLVRRDADTGSLVANTPSMNGAIHSETCAVRGDTTYDVATFSGKCVSGIVMPPTAGTMDAAYMFVTHPAFARERGEKVGKRVKHHDGNFSGAVRDILSSHSEEDPISHDDLLATLHGMFPDATLDYCNAALIRRVKDIPFNQNFPIGYDERGYWAD